MVQHTYIIIKSYRTLKVNALKVKVFDKIKDLKATQVVGESQFLLPVV